MLRNTRFLTCLVAMIGALTAFQPEVSAEPKFSGRVFFDANNNGRWDEGEAGVADAAVTDGVQVVRCGADGRYELELTHDPLIPHQPSRVISVSWPSGTWPSGPWFRRLSSIKEPLRLNFPFTADEQELPFAFIQISDNHDQGSLYATFKDEIKHMGSQVKFCINTGDLMYANYDDDISESEKKYQQYVRNCAYLPVPLFHTIGNHDYAGTDAKQPDTDHPLYALGVYTKYLGPPRWSFTYAGVHFVGLDWAYLDGDHYASGVPEIAVEWMKRDLSRLEAGTRIMVFAHYPSGHPSLWPAMAEHNVTWAFGGHSHKYKRWEYRGVGGATTMNLRGRGACSIGLVQKDRFDIIDRCAGCKDDPEYHSKRCALGELKQYGHQGRRGELTVQEPKTYPSGVHRLQVARARQFEIQLEMMPEGASRYGLQIGPVTGGSPLKLTFDGERLSMGEVFTRYQLHEKADASLKFLILLEDDVIRVFANNRIRYMEPVQLSGRCEVSLFCEGGKAKLVRCESWELKLKE